MRILDDLLPTVAAAPVRAVLVGAQCAASFSCEVSTPQFDSQARSW